MPGSLKLYSVFHKEFFTPAATYVVPIHAGKALSGSNLNLPGDDTGDHISTLNNTFCELTVLYWIWKNAAREYHYMGLCHYRRYFILKPLLDIIKPARIINYYPGQQAIDNVLNQALYHYITHALGTHDVIVQQPMYIHRNKKGLFNLEEHYKRDHIESDWSILMLTIAELYPEYQKSLPAFNQSLKMSFFNMMIAPWNIWDAYLNWLFTILFEVQKRVNVSESAYQARVFGFMSERLMNLYIQHNRLATAYLPVAVFDK